MSNLSQKAGYLKGLLEGIQLNEKDKRDLLLKGIVEAIGDVAEEFSRFDGRDLTATEILMKMLGDYIGVMRDHFDDDYDDDDDDYDDYDDDFDEDDDYEDDDEEDDEDDEDFDEDDDIAYIPHYLRQKGEDDGFEMDEEDEKDSEQIDFTSVKYLELLLQADKPKAISVRCKYCGVTSVFNGSLAGENRRCPSCGETVTVPGNVVVCRSCHKQVTMSKDMMKDGVLFCPECGRPILG